MSPDSSLITLAGEASFYALFKHATVGILVVDTDGYIQLANPCSEKIFGYKKSELHGKRVEVLIPEALKKRHVQHRDHYFADPRARPMGYGLNLFARKKNGSSFPVEISLGYYELEGGRKAIAFVTDITERIKAEEHAKQSEKEYRLIFEGIHEFFIQQQIIKNNNGHITDLLFLEVNPATEKIIGKPRHEIIGHLRSEFFGPLDETLIEIIQRVELTGENIRCQQYIQSLGRWFDHSFYSLKPGQLTTLSIDITQQKKDEEELQRKQSLLEEETAFLIYLNKSGTRLSGINNMQQGLEEILNTAMQLMGADKGNIQFFDSEKQVLTIAAQKGFDKKFLDYFKEVSANDESACGRALKTKRQIVIEDTERDALFAPHRVIARNSRFRSVLSTPLMGQDGLPIGMISIHFSSPVIFSTSDLNKMNLYAQKAESFVTRCKLYEALEQTNALLEKRVTERTQQLRQSLEREQELSQQKSRFVAVASHELRTPLSTILSSVSLIEAYNKQEDEEKRKKHIDRVKSSIVTLVDILNDFLSVEKLEQGAVEIINESLSLQDLAVKIMEGVNTIY
ncbi:PAS domain S-box protein [Panacibacter ginsenosidivorans]|uniref:histidine kinase n=1 Tax=Panacibacter ginsenosidivorans TaxID=1813871 RepID=A0A5B8V4P2_9BACT|nr:PAS domain S-box protein [Panacibacter ginsenosidivorans]QEC66350.1 PAS domain S-box protein [Panacibacter ginsenosidivorans]